MSHTSRSLARALAFFCALSLAHQSLLTAQVVQTAVSATGGQTVPAVSAGTLSSLGPGSLGSPSSVRAAPSLTSSLPAPALGVPSGRVEGRTPVLRPAGRVNGVSVQGRGSVLLPERGRGAKKTGKKRGGLKAALKALAQDEEASRENPGLADLGSEAETPDPGSDSGSQRAAAEAHFSQKAGFSQGLTFDTLDAAYEAYEQGRRGPSHQTQGREAKLKPLTKPKFPFRRIRFNRRTFPSVAFRPDQPIADQIIKAIDAAEDSIEIALYEFRQRDILKALRRARERGVEIRVVIDYKNAFPAKRPGADYWPQRSLELQSLIDEGFDVRVLRGTQRYGIMHNKIAVFDGKLALFGSYNWSYTSERNHYENINFTNKTKSVAALAAYWEYLSSHSVPFAEAKDHAWPREVAPFPMEGIPEVRFNGETLPAWIFSPDPGGEDTVIRAIEAAKKSIDVSMFTLSSPRIVRAIAAAKKRKVRVRVLLDESQAGPALAPEKLLDNLLRA